MKCGKVAIATIVATLASLENATAASSTSASIEARVPGANEKVDVSSLEPPDTKKSIENDVGVDDIIDKLTHEGGGSPVKQKEESKPLKSKQRFPNFWGLRAKQNAKAHDVVTSDSSFPHKSDEEENTKQDSNWDPSKNEKDDGKSSSLENISEKEDKNDDASEENNDNGLSSDHEIDSVQSKDSTENDAAKEKEENKDSTLSDAGEISEHPLTNQTRPSVIYFSTPHGMVPNPRPMPYPYLPQPHPHHVHPQQNQNRKPGSLLSSILSSLFGPQNKPPPSPYGPPIPSPYGPNNNSNEVTILLSTILSLVLRLAIISFTTHILDFFGMGHSDSTAFLPSPAQHYTFERVNDRYRRDGAALMQALAFPPPGVKKSKWKRIFGRRKKENIKSLLEMEQLEGDNVNGTISTAAIYNRTVIILDMKPDSRVGNGVSEQLRDTVSFLIEQHRDHVDRRRSDLTSQLANAISQKVPVNSRTHRGMRAGLGTDLEVLLLLESPGGSVQDYGLASSQLTRLRDEPHITLSICVDRVAASGGYMMACQASPGHLMAAPFSMIGSIGVLMETVNFHEVLKKYGVDPIVIKAGKSKAPLKTLGEVTPEELELAQKDAEVIHEAFRQWVLKARPNVSVSKEWLDKVCTGAVFLGKEAEELGLVDRVVTSDEYIAERIAAGDRVLRLMPYRGPQFGFKLSPLDLLLLGTDAEGRTRIAEKFQLLRNGISRQFASLFRVGSAVGVLNLVHYLATLQSRSSLTWK
ncbi:hypothetical protein ACHAXS_013714 [Conticribra weissflogii]